MSSVLVRACPRYHFDDTDFDPSHDKFKDVIIFSQSVFDRLFDSGETGYVTIRNPETDQSVVAYALTFDSSYQTADGDEVPNAYLRSSLRRAVGLDSDEFAPEVVVTPLDQHDSGPLDVVRFSTKLESTRTDECRAHPNVLSRVGVTDGDEVEVYNPRTGGRMTLVIRAEQRGMSDGEISLSTQCRKLLQCEFPERAGEEETTVLHVRRPVEMKQAEKIVPGFAEQIYRRALDRAVGYNTIFLRVKLGLNIDEGRGTVRVNQETAKMLAIDDGDRVIVESTYGRTEVQCRTIDSESYLIERDEDFTADDIQDRTILLPSTVREQCGVVPDDIVRVRRESAFVAARSIVPSMLGFLGILVSSLQTIELFVAPRLYVPAIGTSVLLGLVAVWLVLWPERKRCR